MTKIEKAQKVLDTIETLKKYIKEDVDKVTASILTTPVAMINKFYSNFFDKFYYLPNGYTSYSTSQVLNEFEGRRGIYIFKVKGKYTVSAAFNSVTCGATWNDMTDMSLDSTSTLYLGKTKSLYTRIAEHFSAVQTSPNSLKLGTTDRKFLFNDIVIYAFGLKNQYNSTKKTKKVEENIVLGSVESLLHDLLIPKVGSSRV